MGLGSRGVYELSMFYVGFFLLVEGLFEVILGLGLFHSLWAGMSEALTGDDLRCRVGVNASPIRPAPLSLAI